MTMNITLGRILRVIAYRGRYALYWVDVGDDGEIVKIHASEEVDMSFKDLDELKAVVKMIDDARKLPVFHVNGDSRHLMSREE